MSKNKNKMTIEEQVGDTSYQEVVSDPKMKKIKIIGGFVGIALLVIVCVIFFQSPKKVEFKFQDMNQPTQRYILNKKTSKLDEGPKDPNKLYFDFKGWYKNSNYKGEALFNNDKNSSLLDFDFSTIKTLTLYAKWEPTKYTVTYDVTGVTPGFIGNFSDSLIEKLKNDNISNGNPTNYTYCHELSEYEKTAYVEYLRELDPEKYVNSPNAFKNVNEQLDIYSNDSQVSTLSIKDTLSVPGWTFLGWFNESDEKVTTLDKREPKNIVLYARWKKN